MTKDEQDALETVTKATVDAALEPVKTALSNVASPFTAEIGKLIALPFKWWNFRASIAIMEKAKKFLDEKGIKPQQVPMKLLAPILEGGSLEQEENMLEHWAQLLASSADPNTQPSILPSFAAILKELSPKEVKILDELYGVFLDTHANLPTLPVNLRSIVSLVEIIGIEYDDLQAALYNLDRLRLIQLPASRNPKDGIYLGKFGYLFVAACRPEQTSGSKSFDIQFTNFPDQRIELVRKKNG